MNEAPRVNIFEHEPDDWWAECLVCGAWVCTSNKTRRAAEQKFGRHLQNHGSYGQSSGSEFSLRAVDDLLRERRALGDG